MANKFQQPIDQANKGIQSIIKNLEDLDNKLTSISSKLSKGFNFTNASNVSNQAKEQAQELKKFEQEALRLRKAREAQIKKESDLRERLHKQRVREEEENFRNLSKAGKAKRLEVQETKKLVGAYAQLIAKQKQAKTTLQNLIVSQGKNAAATKKAQIEYDRYTKKVNLANKATSNFSKTGLGGAVKGFRNLLGAFGLVGGAMLFADMAKRAFNLAKKLDALNFAMETIITNEQELSQTRAFLNDITERYGAEIVTTTERYIKFIAAAKQSNVSMEDTEKIFGTVTKAAGVLGLSTEELNGTYLALEQMLSKGKVTTEELRRQLGERLPGAFGIMADALGVTTVELDKMLRAGEILSSEALPKLADQLEKAYGIENIENVRTLSAETSRLSNAWIDFVGSLTESEGPISKVLIKSMELLTDFVELMGLANKTNEDFYSTLEQNAFVNQSNYYRDIGESALELAKIDKERSENSISSLNKEIKAQEEIINQYKDASFFVTVGNSKLREANEELKKLNQERSTQEGRLRAANNLLKDNIDLIDQQNEGRRTLSDVMADLKKANEELQDSTKEEAKSINKKITLLEAEKKAWERLKKAKEDNAKAIELIGDFNSRNFINAQIQGLKELRDNTSKLSGEYEGIVKSLKQWEDKYERLYGDSQAEKEENAVKRISELAGFYREFSDDLANSAGFDKLNQWFIQLDENDQTMFERLTDEAGEDEWKVYFNAITEIGQEAFALLSSFSGEYFQNQLERLEMEKETALMFAGESAVARENIERQYEERRAAIQRRQAEAEKEQALFNIAINTAQAIVATLGKEGFAGIPLSVIVGAIGAAQLAVVASTKVPEFFRGTMNAPEGWAMVDEKVPEVHTDKYGNIKSLGEDGANMRYLNQGDKIYKSHEYFFNKELGNTLAGNGILPYSDMIGFSSSAPLINIEKQRNDDVIMELKSLKNIISSKSGLTVNIDKNGVQTRMSKGLQNVNLKNNIIKLKGIEV